MGFFVNMLVLVSDHTGRPSLRRLLERTADKDALYLPHRGRLVRLHPVDLAANARGPRAPRPKDDSDDITPVPAPSASQLAFARDLPRMVGPDGGYPEDPNEEK